MAPRPLVLIHGYSASGDSFGRWRELLAAAGRPTETLHVCTYRTLTNEVTLDDIADALDRALAVQAGLDGDEEFDALVHSTGMLVVRAWLAARPERRARLKRLVALAPATFGSPLAHKGRGWLGAVFLGNKVPGPDFLEAGDRILGGLELASPFQWELAHRDLIGGADGSASAPTTFYGTCGRTPFVFVLCGAAPYRGLLRFTSAPGTDGVVRLAGASLNTRKITLDLTVDHDEGVRRRRVQTAPWSNADIPVIPFEGVDHGTIMSAPSPELVRFALAALSVRDAQGFAAWQTDAKRHARRVFARLRRRGALARWQQLLVRVMDHRGHPVPDYFLEFLRRCPGKRKWEPLAGYDMHVHTNSKDPSLRAFHVNLDTLPLEEGDRLGARLIASSGTSLVAYSGYSDEEIELYSRYDPPADRGEWSGVIDLTTLPRIEFFHPFTTTLVEFRLNREPQPPEGPTELLWFPEPTG